MGRLRTSFISAVNYATEMMEKENVNIATASHKASIRFNENEDQIKSKIERNEKKAEKDALVNWIGYVGPVLNTSTNNSEIVSVKTKARKNKENKITVENLISKNKDYKVEINNSDWKAYSKEFFDESKCDKFLTKKSFNNAFELITDSGKTKTVKENKTTKKETVKNEEKTYRINDECSKAVKDFNNLKEKRFQDFIALKTFGNDGLSPVRLKDIIKHIPKDALIFAEGEFDNEDDLLTCLKWNMRGLSIEDAVEKVKVDDIIKNR